MTAESIAQAFHEAYERLAPRHGYVTRTESAKRWEAVPEKNRALMVAVVQELLDRKVIGELVTYEEVPPEEWYPGAELQPGQRVGWPLGGIQLRGIVSHPLASDVYAVIVDADQYDRVRRLGFSGTFALPRDRLTLEPS